MLVYDVCSAQSLAKAEECRDRCERYWRDAPPIVALVGNKRDCLHASAGRAVQTADAIGLAARNGWWFFETSGLTGQTVRVAFLSLVGAALDRMRSRGPGALSPPAAVAPSPPLPLVDEARSARLRRASEMLMRGATAAPPPPRPAAPPPPAAAEDEATGSEMDSGSPSDRAPPPAAARSRQRPFRLQSTARRKGGEDDDEGSWWSCWT